MRLDGLTVMVTRPSPQGVELCELLSAAGATPVFFPTVDIIPPSEEDKLKSSIKHLAHYDVVIFTSPQTVYQTKKLLHTYWPTLPSHLQVVAIGKGTAQALLAAGLPVHQYPEKNWSSEGLLDLPLFHGVQGKNIAIIRGETGRELLLETLARRGATVDNVIAYRRALPKVDTKHYRELVSLHKIDIIICTSNELLQNLITLLGEVSVPLMVISHRMLDFAEKRGFTPILLAENASHDAIISELVKHKDYLCQMKKINT